MKTRLCKWGSSLALRLSGQVAVNQQITEGADLEVEEHENGFFVRAIVKAYTLDELLNGVSRKNLHSESFVDEPVGKELW